MQFEWDPEKAASNWRDHSIAFEVAVRVFDDPFHIDEDDIEASEYRPRAIGYVECRLLLVVFTMRGEVYRIISARLGDRKDATGAHAARSECGGDPG